MSQEHGSSHTAWLWTRGSLEISTEMLPGAEGLTEAGGSALREAVLPTPKPNTSQWSKRESKAKPAAWHVLVSGVTQHHFYHFLLIRSESLVSTDQRHSRERTSTLYGWEDYQKIGGDIFKTLLRI